MIKLILCGCMGRMGRAVRTAAENDPDCEIVAGVDTAGSGEGLTFPAYSAIGGCEMPADVVIDFSAADALDDLLRYGTGAGVPLVLCATGLSPEQQSAIRAASEQIAVFQSANMSLGINLIIHMMNRAARFLYDAHFDVEIIEKHHNQKLDAPSGTALMLAGAVSDALGGGMNYVYDRSHTRAKRDRREIGIQALRGGTIVGEHTVTFAGRDEVIAFTHTAQSREVFAVGALKAASFIKGKPPGLYDMQDLIGAV